MPTIVRVSLLLGTALTVLQSPGWGASISVNTDCRVGNCSSPEILPQVPPSSANLPFDFRVILPNTDTYRVFGSVVTFNGAGSDYIGLFPESFVTYLGNASGGPSETDTLTLEFRARFERAGSSARLYIGQSGFFRGDIAPDSTVQWQFSMDGNTLQLVGPFSPPSNFGCSHVVVGGPTPSQQECPDPIVSGLGSLVSVSATHTYRFGAGSLPGASASIGVYTPEPASLLLVFPGLAMLWVGRRRRGLRPVSRPPIEI